MKNKKLIAVLGFALLAVALFNTEKFVTAAANIYGSVLVGNVNPNGQPIDDAALIGRKYKTFSNSTTETVVCSAACVLDGIYLSSGATSSYIILADTATADGSATSAQTVFPYIYAPGAGVNSAPLANVKPVLFTNGMTVDASATGIYATIVYHMQ